MMFVVGVVIGFASGVVVCMGVDVLLHMVMM